MSDTLLLDACRALGLPCRGRVNTTRRVALVAEPKVASDFRFETYARVVTWTTDASVAEQARLAGASVVVARHIFNHEPIGFEVSFDPEQYALTPADHAAS